MLAIDLEKKPLTVCLVLVYLPGSERDLSPLGTISGVPLPPRPLPPTSSFFIFVLPTPLIKNPEPVLYPIRTKSVTYLADKQVPVDVT